MLLTSFSTCDNLCLGNNSKYRKYLRLIILQYYLQFKSGYNINFKLQENG